MLSEQAHKLRVYIGESDKHDGLPLYEWIVREARNAGMGGAIVLRGIEGFGAQSQIHTAKILAFSTELPVVIELIDSIEKIEEFIERIDPAIAEGMVTVEEINLRIYRKNKK